SGILKPDVHYIPLKKDFSNIAEVVRKLKDVPYLQHVADIAYREIALNPLYSYKRFVAQVDQMLEEEAAARTTARPSESGDSFALLRVSVGGIHAPVRTAYVCFIVFVRFRLFLLRVAFRAKVLLPVWTRIPPKGKSLLRPIVRLKR